MAKWKKEEVKKPKNSPELCFGSANIYDRVEQTENEEEKTASEYTLAVVGLARIQSA